MGMVLGKARLNRVPRSCIVQCLLPSQFLPISISLKWPALRNGHRAVLLAHWDQEETAQGLNEAENKTSQDCPQPMD